MKYVDGYVFPVPRKNLKAYRRMARTGEMKEIASTAGQAMEMPFDMKRMAYAGFRVMVGR